MLSQMMQSPQMIGAIVAVVLYLTLTTFQSTVPAVSKLKAKYSVTRDMSPVMFSVGVGATVFLVMFQKDKLFSLLSKPKRTTAPLTDYDAAQMAPPPMTSNMGFVG